MGCVVEQKLLFDETKYLRMTAMADEPDCDGAASSDMKGTRPI